MIYFKRISKKLDKYIKDKNKKIYKTRNYYFKRR